MILAWFLWGSVLIKGDLRKYAKKIKFLKFWERPLFNISEYAFKSLIFIKKSVDLIRDLIGDLISDLNQGDLNQPTLVFKMVNFVVLVLQIKKRRIFFCLFFHLSN